MITRHTATALIRLAMRLLPPPLAPWGRAMAGEVETIARADHALRFAIGCLGFAAIECLKFRLIHPFSNLLLANHQEASIMTLNDTVFQQPRKMVGLCAILATGLGIAFMHMAGAPSAYLAMNVAALVIGIAAVPLIALISSKASLSQRATGLALSAALLLTGQFGMEADGATRWFALGPFSIQTSLVVLPLVAINFSRTRDTVSTAGIILAALSLALQPDRAMAGALAAAMLILAIMRPGRAVLVALAASLCGFIAALSQADTLATAPFVDQILWTAFAVNPLAGLAVVAGSILLIVPAITGWMRGHDDRPTYAVFGAIWAAIISAAALGNYPTPLVGYGGSAILGYLLCMFSLPKLVRVEQGDSVARSSTPTDEGATKFSAIPLAKA